MGKLMVNSVPLHAGQSDIWTDITVDFLTLDDAPSNGGNNNIGDGSPNYSRIAAAFGNHGPDAPAPRPLGAARGHASGAVMRWRWRPASFGDSPRWSSAQASWPPQAPRRHSSTRWR